MPRLTTHCCRHQKNHLSLEIYNSNPYWSNKGPETTAQDTPLQRWRVKEVEEAYWVIHGCAGGAALRYETRGISNVGGAMISQLGYISPGKLI